MTGELLTARVALPGDIERQDYLNQYAASLREISALYPDGLTDPMRLAHISID